MFPACKRLLVGCVLAAAAYVVMACTSDTTDDDGNAGGEAGQDSGGNAQGGTTMSQGGAGSNVTASGGMGGTTAGSGGTFQGGMGGQAAPDAGVHDASTDSGTNNPSVSTRSSGCGKQRTGTSSFVKPPTIRVGSADRSYFIYVPKNYDPNRPYPLLFTFHGAYGPDTDPATAGGPPSIVDATKNDAIVIAPNGAKQAAVSNTTGWDLKVGSPDLQFVRSMIETTEREYCIDPQRIFSHGFSMGGGFSLLVGCVLGDLIRGVAVIEGGFREPDVTPGANACVGHAAAWVVHGTRDTAVPMTLAQKAREQLYLPRHQCASSSKSVAPSPCKSFDGCMAGYPQVFCVTDADHNPQSAFTNPGTWNFFQALSNTTVP